MTNEDVKVALVALRDAAENEAGKDSPDLKVIAEHYNKFNDAWVSMRVSELEAEQNPDTDVADTDGGPQDAEAAQTKAVADAQPSTAENAKPLRANKPVEVPSTKPAK